MITARRNDIVWLRGNLAMFGESFQGLRSHCGIYYRLSTEARLDDIRRRLV